VLTNVEIVFQLHAYAYLLYKQVLGY